MDLPDKSARYVPTANLHMTLHFIGNVAESAGVSLQEAARGTEAGSFRMTLNVTGRFKKARIGWLGCASPPDELFVLQQNLGRQLQACGFKMESRDYNPHVTMIRKQSTALTVKTVEPIEWQVEDFVLINVVSVPNGVRYDILERYPLNV